MPQGPPVVMPDPVVVIRDYLLSQAAVTALVGQRVTTVIPRDPTWPLVRLTQLNTYEQAPRRLDRVYVQLDCFAPTDPAAQALAQTVRGALVAAVSWVHPTAVVTGTERSSLRNLPDGTYTPPMPRWVLSIHVYMHPNP